ncbi:putative NADH-flavin reductase [Litoreibacter ponti]|uniref:Putative NADH-flavin reductase n=1 Tax=Litoreibacter ponti TaxID=1510457 RepID=A0A2T6BKJ8_9RHOB|nr:NAD(P)-binding oxidoreductase [Litoreibacter ponti]PTX56600.1 putative NADH-flavin reductase [Litoreibacter ponti]
MSAPILIMGATSGIGKCAVKEGLSRGLHIRAFARSADEMEPRDGLEPCPGDALEADDVARALDGVSAVIYALGIKERIAMLWEKETLFSETTKVLLDQMPKAGVTRLIAVTGFGAGRSIEAMSTIERMGHRAILGRPYEDKDRQETLIMDSDLDWTIARPVILTNNAKAKGYSVLTEPSQWKNGLISRATVADYLIDAAQKGLNVRQDVVLRA